MQAGGQGFDPPWLHYRGRPISTEVLGPFAFRPGGCEVGRGERRGNTVGNACLPDRLFGVGARLVLELVDDVPVAGQGQARVVAELAGDVDDAAAFVQEEAGE